MASTTGPRRQRAGKREPTTSWREEVLAHVDELRVLACWLRARQRELETAPARRSRVRRSGNGPPVGSSAGVDLLMEGIEHHLLQAAAAAERDADRSRWGRLKAGFSGVDVEFANNHVDAADVQILRAAPLTYDRAILPSLLAVARRHLSARDSRMERMEALARSGEPFTQADGDLVAAVVRDAGRESRREIARVRSFRNVLLMTALVLTTLAIGVTVAGVLAQDAIPLCFEPGGTEVVCPLREVPIEDGNTMTALHAANDAWDVPLVQLIGLIAAAVASAVSLRNINGTATPFALPVALAVLKLPTGMLTAVLGIRLLRGGFVPGLSALDSPAQILAWALVFGYAQQLFTQFVDQQAKSVLADVRGAADAPRA